jgi:hypothetical protein
MSDTSMGPLQMIEVRAFRLLLSAFVRGRVHMHFRDPVEAVAALIAAGFSSAEVEPAAAIVGDRRDGASGLTHILEASTT